MMWVYLAAACLCTPPGTLARLRPPTPRSWAPAAVFLAVGCCVFFGRPTVVVAAGCILACALWLSLIHI